jgi:hypothetical protein
MARMVARGLPVPLRRRFTCLALVVGLAATACAPMPARSTPSPTAEADVARVLDDWHDAAAKADEERYFGHIAEGGVFLGTDMTERWEKQAFRAYAHPHFAKGKAWSFHAVERHVRFDADGETAWFDERLETPNLGPARGSGVLVRGDNGVWRIAHYDLSVPIPNEKFTEIKAIIAR